MNRRRRALLSEKQKPGLLQDSLCYNVIDDLIQVYFKFMFSRITIQYNHYKKCFSLHRQCLFLKGTETFSQEGKTFLAENFY